MGNPAIRSKSFNELVVKGPGIWRFPNKQTKQQKLALDHERIRGPFVLNWWNSFFGGQDLSCLWTLVTQTLNAKPLIEMSKGEKRFKGLVIGFIWSFFSAFSLSFFLTLLVAMCLLINIWLMVFNGNFPLCLRPSPWFFSLPISMVILGQVDGGNDNISHWQKENLTHTVLKPRFIQPILHISTWLAGSEFWARLEA